MIVNVWLECLDSKDTHSCVLAIGDNMSAIGWLSNTSSLDPSWAAHSAHLFAARHLATILLEYNCCLASQHIKGDLNVVADLLSFAGNGDRGKAHPLAYDDPPNDILTQRFRDYLPSQVPANFEICQLPSEILSWVTRVLRITASSLGVVRKAGMRTSTESGDGGLGSESTSDTLLTPTSLCYLTTNKSYIPKLSSSATEGQTGLKGGPLQELVRDQWLQALSAKPQVTWLRRFGTISGQAPFTSRAVRTCAHLSDPCLKRTRMTIPQATNNEPSPQNY